MPKVMNQLNAQLESTGADRALGRCPTWIATHIVASDVIPAGGLVGESPETAKKGWRNLEVATAISVHPDRTTPHQSSIIIIIIIVIVIVIVITIIPSFSASPSCMIENDSSCIYRYIPESSEGLKFEPLNHQNQTWGLKFDTLGGSRYVTFPLFIGSFPKPSCFPSAIFEEWIPTRPCEASVAVHQTRHHCRQRLGPTLSRLPTQSWVPWQREMMATKFSSYGYIMKFIFI